MPFKSKAQRRKFAELLVKGEISPETFEEWSRETGAARLPERAPRQRRKRATAKKNRAAGTRSSTQKTRATANTKSSTAKQKRSTARKPTPKRRPTSRRSGKRR